MRLRADVRRACYAWLGVSVLAITLGAAPGRSQSTEPMLVAVLDLETEDASAADDAASREALIGIGKAATDALRNAFRLGAGGAYTLVDERAIAAALSDEGSAFPDCSQPDCARAIGRALGAQRVIAGTVTKISTIIWFVTIRAIDVESGQVAGEVPIELKGDISELLPKGMAALARWINRMPAGEIARGSSHLTRDQVLERLAAAGGEGAVDFSGLNLAGLDLSGLSLREADLSRADLTGADLSGADLFGANLTGASLAAANLRRTTFDVSVLRDANLAGADLAGASLYATILERADLTEAVLTDARIIGVLIDAKLTRATLEGANLGADPGNQPMGLMRTDLTGADLTGADLVGANLAKVDLTRANLTGADLTRADLSYADLRGAILRSVRGLDAVHGLETAKNLDQAILNR